MAKTPKYITVRRVLSRATVERIFTPEEISQLIPLSTAFKSKPIADWFFCVFVFSVTREAPDSLRLTTVSTTIERIHKHSITPGLLDIAPEIEAEENPNWVQVIRAHYKAEHDLIRRKVNSQEMSEFTRAFMDCGAAEAEQPLEFVIYDADNKEEKPGPTLVK
jgi:hypothetical protein